MKVDINCDLGEGITQSDCENDALLMPFISRCNIACGGHAGNDLTMKLSVKNAIQNNLKIGAHPGYPDFENFGRLTMNIPIESLLDEIQEQVNKLQGILQYFNAKLDHIKFHGALYNDIEKSPILAKQIAHLLSNNYPTLRIIGLADGLLQQNCIDLDLKFLKEAFIDRRYQTNRQLSARTLQGAVITEQVLAIEQALAIARKESIRTIDKQSIIIDADTLCLHGDNKNSLAIAKSIHHSLIKME